MFSTVHSSVRSLYYPTMTGKERVLAAINHEKPDRTPLIIGQTNATGIKMKPYRALKRILGYEAPDRYLYDWPELGTALPDEAVLERLGSDARSVLDLAPAWVRERAASRPEHSQYIDDWGTGNIEIEGGKWFPGIHPMADMRTIAEIEAYPWPDMDDPTRVAHVRSQAEALSADGMYAIIGCPWLLFPFERAQAMQGMEVFLENMLLEPEFAEALIWKIEGLCKTLMGHFLDACGDRLDIIKIGDDLGAQESLLISPASYRSILKPAHADLIAFIKSRTQAKVFFHSDGDVFDLVPDLVEIGVDILNPIQSGAGRMFGPVAPQEGLREGADVLRSDRHSARASERDPRRGPGRSATRDRYSRRGWWLPRERRAYGNG